MPFRLKNVSRTYQRTATPLLHDLIHKETEVYIDDMTIKSKERVGHILTLQKFFTRRRKSNMHLNPQKCAFRVTPEKLLGYVINLRGIEVDPSKIKVIQWLHRTSRRKYEDS